MNNTPQDPLPEQRTTPPTVPVNPLTNGLFSKSSTIIALAALTAFVVFLALDAIQFIDTGKESTIFLELAHGTGALGVGGLIVALATSWIKGKK